jgi:hypothetical protein
VSLVPFVSLADVYEDRRVVALDELSRALDVDLWDLWLHDAENSRAATVCGYRRRA